MKYNKQAGNIEKDGKAQIVTERGAFEFFGWMTSAAKRSPRLAGELEAFAKFCPENFQNKQFTN